MFETAITIIENLYNRIFGSGRRCALVIGGTPYEHSQMSIPSIHDGVVAVAKALETHYDKTPNFEVSVITDDRNRCLPYRDENDLRDMIVSFLKSGHKSDTGLLYLICHGSDWDKTHAQRPYYVFPAPRPGKEDVYIEMEWLYNKLQKSTFGQLLVVVDSCHAAHLFTDGKHPLRPGLSVLVSAVADQRAWAYHPVRTRSRTLFTGYFCDALRGKGADPLTGVVTLSSIYNYVSLCMGQKQTPEFCCNISTVLPIRKCKPGFTAEELWIITHFFTPTLVGSGPAKSGSKGEFRYYPRRERLGSENLLRFYESEEILLKHRLMIRDTEKSGKVRYFLTSLGRRLYDLVALDGIKG